MTSGLDKLVQDSACLRLEVAQLRGEVIALRHLISDRDGELVALKIMLREWPVLLPDDHPVVQH